MRITSAVDRNRQQEESMVGILIISALAIYTLLAVVLLRGIQWLHSKDDEMHDMFEEWLKNPITTPAPPFRALSLPRQKR